MSCSHGSSRNLPASFDLLAHSILLAQGRVVAGCEWRECGLTHHSSGAPSAGHQVRTPVRRPSNHSETATMVFLVSLSNKGG